MLRGIMATSLKLCAMGVVSLSLIAGSSRGALAITAGSCEQTYDDSDYGFGGSGGESRVGVQAISSINDCGVGFEVLVTSATRADALDPIVILLNSKAADLTAPVRNFRIDMFEDDVKGLTVNGIPVAGASFEILLTVVTTYTIQYDYKDLGTFHFIVVVDPENNTLSAFNIQTGDAPPEEMQPTAEETQKIIASFMTNRANNILSNQPSFIGFMNGSNNASGGPLGNLAFNGNDNTQVLAFSTSKSQILGAMDRDASKRFNSAIAATEKMAGGRAGTSKDAEAQSPPLGYGEDGAFSAEEIALASSRAGTWDIWAQIYGARSHADTSDSSFWVGYAGTHYFINEYTMLGVVAQLDWSDESNSAVNSQAEGMGWMLGPYIAGQLPGENLFYEARAAWGTSNNDVSPDGTYTDSFDTTRWLASGKVSGYFVLREVTVTPAVSVSYYEETQESYTDSNAVFIAEQTVSLGELRFGPSISKAIALGDDYSFIPTLGVSGVWNFGINDNVASQGSVLGNDDLRASVNAGLVIAHAGGIRFALEGFYDGIGISNYDAYGGTARVNIPLH